MVNNKSYVTQQEEEQSMSTFMAGGATQQGIWHHIENGQTGLVVAALQKDPAQLKFTDPESRSNNTVLHAIALKDPEMLKAVVAVIDPKELNPLNKDNRTPLMVAGFNGLSDNAEILMAAGADVNFANKYGDNLLSATVMGKNMDDVSAKQKPAFDNILSSAIGKYGAQVTPKVLDTCDIYDDAGTQSFIEKKAAEPKAAAPVAAAARISAPASKMG